MRKTWILKSLKVSPGLTGGSWSELSTKSRIYFRLNCKVVQANFALSMFKIISLPAPLYYYFYCIFYFKISLINILNELISSWSPHSLFLPSFSTPDQGLPILHCILPRVCSLMSHSDESCEQVSESGWPRRYHSCVLKQTSEERDWILRWPYHIYWLPRDLH